MEKTIGMYYEGDSVQQALFGHYLDSLKVNDKKFQQFFFNEQVVEGFNHLEYLDRLIQSGVQLVIGKCSDGVYINL